MAARLPAAMREAIAEARQARYAFGAVLLDVGSGQTVFRAHNISRTATRRPMGRWRRGAAPGWRASP